MGKTQVKTVLVRTDPETIKSLDELAKTRYTSRASIIRGLLANSRESYPFLESLQSPYITMEGR